MLNKICKLSFLSMIISSPIFAFAALGQTGTLLLNAQNIITTILIPMVFTLALLFFFYGVAKYVWSAGGDKEEGKKIMIWGVVALFVMSSVWGLVYFIRDNLGINNNTNMPIPTIGGSGGNSVTSQSGSGVDFSGGNGGQFEPSTNNGNAIIN